MIIDLIRYELKFLLSNPKHLNDVVEWIANDSLAKLDDEKLNDLWVEKVQE